MRVSLGTQAENVIAQMHRANARLEELQNQVSSGKRITKPSDDPVGTARSLNIRSALAKIEQFKSNSAIANTLLGATDVALQTISDALAKAQEIALAAANSPLTPESKDGYAVQLQHIEERIRDALNTREMDRYIFAGNATDKAPFVESAGATPYEYVGDDGVLSIQLHTGTTVPVSIPGDLVANMNGAADPDLPDVFSLLRDLREDVLAENSSAASAHLADLDEHFSNVLSLRAQVGARIQNVETLTNLSEDAAIRLKKLLSETEDVDLAEAVVQLKTQEQAYQAALAVAGRITQMTLVDWI